jgi:hypothetical protein
MANFIVDWQSKGLEALPGKSSIVLTDKTIDTASTSLTLTGSGVLDFGEIQQENFIRLLENFTSKDAPANPTIGQLWFYYFGLSRDLRIWTGTEWRGMSITGSEGPQGPAGPQGITGPPSTVAGPRGPTGATGPTGALGPQGPTGITGVAGDKGPQGPTGPGGINAVAPAGPAGTIGPTGVDGPVGAQGPQGPVGPAIQYYVTSPYFIFENQTIKMSIYHLAGLLVDAVSCADFVAMLNRTGYYSSSDPVGSAGE